MRWLAAANNRSLTNELSCHGPVPPETCIIMNRQQALTTCYDRQAVTWKLLKVKKRFVFLGKPAGGAGPWLAVVTPGGSGHCG